MESEIKVKQSCERQKLHAPFHSFDTLIYWANSNYCNFGSRGARDPFKKANKRFLCLLL